MFDDAPTHLVTLRHALHQNPELGFEEQATSDRVCAHLDELGVEYERGIGVTGVVAWVQGEQPGGSVRVGLRADMDALPIHETSGVAHASKVPGRMHACGHDGHTTMLLGAVEHFVAHRDFAGTVYFIFQPAEEGVGGASAMIADGLFERYPMDTVYALHNWPALPIGQFGLIEGPIMAGGDRVDIAIHGRGGHGGLNPHGCIDPVRIAGELITRAHSIVGRDIDPLAPAVVSLCSIRAGDLAGFAVIPDTARLSGTLRALDNDTREKLRERLRAICAGLEATYGATIELSIEDKFSVTYNHVGPTATARAAIASTFGESALAPNYPSCMGGEDFSYMLDVCPGAYIHVGSGDAAHTHGLHHPAYDFNDRIMAPGIALFVQLARDTLAKAA
ncbi:hydrolase [Salinisphaera shabanensis T35B1]|uniref:amidohydrolase n=1 Tax=Salinisphaera shabanensis TaxID=180542 RepID=UPI00333F54D5